MGLFTLDADSLSSCWVLDSLVVNKLRLHSRCVLKVCRLVTTNVEIACRRSKGGLAIGLAVDIFALDTFDVSSVA